METIYFSKVQFRSGGLSEYHTIGIKLTEDQYKELLPYCNSGKFEPYRNGES